MLNRKRLALLVTALLAGCHEYDEIRSAPPPPDRNCQPQDIRVTDKCAVEPPSCSGQPRTCGPNGNESCCVYDLVDTAADPNRIFERGWDKSGVDVQEDQPVVGWQTRGAATAIVSPYYLDRYEVTVGRFRQFYAGYDEWLRNNPLVGAGTHSRSTKMNWQNQWKMASLMAISKANLAERLGACEPRVLADLQDPTGQNDHHPMTCLNWYESYLFCVFDGARLPTEAEWNYAAAGGSQQRPYPWSKDGELTADESFANVAAPAGAFQLFDVGHFPKGLSRYGQHDLAGNAYEWVFDRCGPTCREYRTNGETDPVEMASADLSVILRGGSFRFGWRQARTAYRFNKAGNDVDGRFPDIGVRCARNGP
jgi:formylglycine-generating enzyme required for sulfatase activity